MLKHFLNSLTLSLVYICRYAIVHKILTLDTHFQIAKWKGCAKNFSEAPILDMGISIIPYT